MLNFIWSLIVVSSIICAVFLGKTQNLSNAFIDSTADAVDDIFNDHIKEDK